MSPEPAAVETADLRHLYGERVALDGVTLSVQPGEMFGLLGPNGGGKTTLFRILTTLMAPSAGTARVFGADTVGHAGAARRAMGVVFQSCALDRKLTASENLWAQGRLYGLGGARLRERMGAVLDAVDMAGRAGEIVESFSGGMMRRVEIAKALLHEPRLLLMDEPGTGLDPSMRRDLRELQHQLSRSTGVTIMLTTHLMDEAEHCDRVAILDRGRVAAVGTPAELCKAVGGEVITLESDNPTALRAAVAAGAGVDARETGGALRIEVSGPPGTGAALLERVTRDAPGLVRAARVGLPTLEDAFSHFTGRTFGEADREGGDAEAAATTQRRRYT